MQDEKTLFKEAIRVNKAVFEGKMQQNRLFRLQESLAEKLIEGLRQETRVLQNDSLLKGYLDSYIENSSSLEGTGKGFQVLLLEKAYTDLFRIFEEFLHDLFESLFRVFPKFLNRKAKDDKEGIQVPFRYLFIETDIERCKGYVIEQRIRSYVQGSNIAKIIERFSTVFNIKISLTKEDKDTCSEIALIRNVIIHNNAEINESFLKDIRLIYPNQEDITYNRGDKITGSRLQSLLTKHVQHLEKVSSTLLRDIDCDLSLKALINYR